VFLKDMSPLRSAIHDHASPVMASQDDLLCADYFGKLRKIICSLFVGIQRNMVWRNLWSILYLMISLAICQ
jgi:hypothetical protein